MPSALASVAHAAARSRWYSFRPDDLRHACVSTWHNAGVAATQVAEWAGQSVDVLLRIYAKCVEGQDEAAKKRIAAALTESRLFRLYPRPDSNRRYRLERAAC